jgi:hypothetical protein
MIIQEYPKLPLFKMKMVWCSLCVITVKLMLMITEVTSECQIVMYDFLYINKCSVSMIVFIFISNFCHTLHLSITI